MIGAGRGADPASAALLNGTAGTWIDMNEGNLSANGHPGIQVIPLAWALAEHRGRSGRDVVAAFIVGYEVSARIKRASATRLAVHPHGTFGTIGAAVALARLLGYDPAAHDLTGTWTTGWAERRNSHSAIAMFSRFHRTPLTNAA